MTSLNRKLFRDVIHLRGQLIAAALVVACGVASFVTMRSAYDSLLTTREAYYNAYRFADVFARATRVPEGMADEIRRIPGVAAVQTRVVQGVTLDVPGLNEPATGLLVSMPDVQTPVLNDLYIRDGRYFTSGRSDEVMVSEAFAQANTLEPGDRIGAVVNGTWRDFTIIGIALSPEYVYEIGNASMLPDNRRFGVLWVPREVLSAAYDMEGAWNDVALTLSHGADEQEVIARLDELLRVYGGVGAMGKLEQTSNQFLESELGQLRASGTTIPAIFLGVAAFLLHIVLSRLVNTQRDQVAVLKAFGYPNIVVGLHYLGIAMTAVVAGCIAGILLGLWAGSAITDVYAQFYRFPVIRYVAGTGAIGSAVLISIVSAVLGAVSAVRGAVKLPPAEAMRPEPPARFKPGIFERIGLGKLFSTGARMVLRSLERNPWKAGLSVLGIALSVAILIVGRFTQDSIDLLIEIQFELSDRTDVTVAFTRPLPPRAERDLTALPGVLRVEPYRVVAGEISHGYRSKRTGITGLAPGAELRRIIDADRVERPLPATGLLMSQALAKVLEVGPGDTVNVEILEGTRPAQPMVVAGLIDDFIGLSVYIGMDQLNDVMRYEAISGAYIQADPLKVNELNEALKKTPAVAGATFRQATLDSFNETIAASQGISRTILIIFASVIAIGVIYNSARIALSERGRELASLRVLGFRKGEVAMLLLGEQAIITALALPVGFLIGWGMALAMAESFATELFRFPVLISPATLGFATIVTAISFIASAFLVRRRIYNLDLIEVLKTRE